MEVAPFFVGFHNLRSFVAIYIMSRFTHFFRNFFLAKIAFTATSHVFCMYDLKSQTSVPDQMIHDDLIDAYLSTDSIECSLKQAYEIKLSEALEALATENPRWKKEEVEKQAVAQASPCEKAVIKFLIKNCPGKAGSEIFKCGQGSSEAGGHEG